MRKSKKKLYHSPEVYDHMYQSVQHKLPLVFWVIVVCAASFFGALLAILICG
jgi:hypothetical protein